MPTPTDYRRALLGRGLRTVGALAALGLIALAVVFYDKGPVQKQTGQPARAAPSETTPANLDDTRSPEPVQPASGPGISSTGIRVVAAVRADGTFDVAETIIFGRTRNRLMLAPPRAADGGVVFSTARPRAEMVQVTVNGQPLPLMSGTVAGPRNLLLPTPASKVELRYHLVGATIRSIPSVAGRGLAMLAPLTAPTGKTLPTNLSVGGGLTVRNVSCPRLAPAKRLCATGDGSRLQPPPGLAAGDATFLVQLDLPKPS